MRTYPQPNVFVQIKRIRNHQQQQPRNFEKITSKCVTSFAAADGFALLGVKSFVGTVLTKTVSRIHRD